MKKEFVFVLLLIFITLPLIVFAKNTDLNLNVREGESAQETFVVDLNSEFDPNNLDVNFDIGSDLNKFTEIIKVSDNEYDIVIKPESGFDAKDLKNSIKVKIKDDNNSEELKLKVDIKVLPSQEKSTPQVELSFNLVLFLFASIIVLLIFFKSHKKTRKRFNDLLKHPKRLFKKLGF